VTPAPDPLVLLTADPPSTAVLCDFDGTLADIVDDPAVARPVAGAPDVLARLAATYGRVGVLSGRPLDFLGPFFPPEVFLAGLYGLEVRDGGVRRTHPDAERWRSVIDDAAWSCERLGPAGMRVEHKGLSVTLHYRSAPELADAVGALAGAEAARTGLEARSARMSVELHPPVAADKGTALRGATAGMTTVFYVGDDLGDLPAFDALDELAGAAGPEAPSPGAGVTVTLRGVVRSDEVDPVLLARADVVFDRPSDVVGFLERVATGA